jgi:hypothetical protein
LNPSPLQHRRVRRQRGSKKVLFGAPERMMKFPERALHAGIGWDLKFMFDPVYAPVRKTQRFKI